MKMLAHQTTLSKSGYWCSFLIFFILVAKNGYISMYVCFFAFGADDLHKCTFFLT